ncbi:hypothetical protein DFH09DRAFT_1271559 [Mycena vulgaris]|nr:hypothetical protein DFH09DRAFT_1271559 [Mycena vulgaris]
MPAIPASSPHVVLSCSCVVLAALLALIGLLTGMIFVIHFGQRKVAARRVKCIDDEARLVAGGHGLFVKRKTATVSPADVLEKTRKAPPTPLLLIPFVKRTSIHALLVKDLAVAPGRFVTRVVYARLGASPLCAVLSVQEPVTDRAAAFAVDFAHLFTGPLEDDDDDLEDTNSIALDTSPWTAVCEGSPFPATHSALKEVLFVVQPVGNLQTTTHDGPFTVLVLGAPGATSRTPPSAASRRPPSQGPRQGQLP